MLASRRSKAERVESSLRSAQANSPEALIQAVVYAFLVASRGGEVDVLLAVLDPDVVLQAEQAAVTAAHHERFAVQRR